ncbi:shikimate dehydrogenase, partial [Francisella tularensis subsp. holarctica]|nr:shikimate dehydrogenase [Francisella tularensis subsp. holarctica]
WCQAYNIASADFKGMLIDLSIAVFKYWSGL